MDSIDENDELLKVKLHKEKIISNRVKLEYLKENFKISDINYLLAYISWEILTEVYKNNFIIKRGKNTYFFNLNDDLNIRVILFKLKYKNKNYIYDNYFKICNNEKYLITSNEMLEYFIINNSILILYRNISFYLEDYRYYRIKFDVSIIKMLADDYYQFYLK